MKIQARYVAGVVVLAMGLLVGATGCGSDSAGTSANVTFRSEPAADIWVDGTNKGSTPIVIALDKGSHEIKFRAAGFEDAVSKLDVEAGSDLSVNAVLTVAGTGDTQLASVAKALGIEHTPFEKPKVHRGSSNNAVMLYWPQKNVRKEGLASWRIDVTDEYEGDGFVVFKKGNKELHREPLNPNSFEVVGTIPETVREQVKRGSTIKWGVVFESKRKKPVWAKAKVVDSRKFDQRMAKLERRKFFQRQPEIIKRKMRNKIYQQNRLYSEGLIDSLDMARSHPNSTMPFEDMINNARRLGLKETPLFQEASQFVLGAGRGRGGGIGVGGQGRSGNNSGLGAGVGSMPDSGGGLPPVFAMPSAGAAGPVKVEQGGGGARGFAKKGFGSNQGVEVKPTPKAEKRDPGPITDDPTGGGVRVDPGADRDGRQAAIDELKQQIAEAERSAEQASEAEGRVREATEAAERAASDLRSAEQALEQIKQQRDAGNATDADVRSAEQAVYDAKQARDRASNELAEVQGTARQALESTGSKREAEAALEDLKRQLEALQSETPPEPGTDPSQPGHDPAGQLAQMQQQLSQAQRAAQDAIDDRNALEKQINDLEAKANLTQAEQRELAEAKARKDDADRNVESADKRVRDLEKQIQESGGD